ncbi:predicted protein [Verticillium alfalfae VaMs.102]|uniref:Predicted protein n=1 Tax=Verticillium alfalfae (strain VaMs.102 / ATCC MYA-4576 / FGSC 10136) TaxID=526221 RepID=C9SLZ7_VERA1|nr:predicted protein [Verticillium alfalfae VaMs.102]EEY19812.1 predicted protein [Verticillium alfalfae VaMs.102]
MFRSVQKAGIRVMPASRVESLMISGKNHRITGVVVQLISPGWKSFNRHESHAPWSKASAFRSWADRCVPQPRKKQLPELRQVAPQGTRGDNGSGKRLGQSVGGVTGNMDPFRESVIVSHEGRRFITEPISGLFIADGAFGPLKQANGR